MTPVAFFIIVSYMDHGTLYCASEDLYTSLQEATAFCVITGTYLQEKKSITTIITAYTWLHRYGQALVHKIAIILINIQELCFNMHYFSLPYSGCLMCRLCFGDWCFLLIGGYLKSHIN